MQNDDLVDSRTETRLTKSPPGLGNAAPDSPTVGDWISPANRKSVSALDAIAESHHGTHQSIRDWIDRPTLLMFFFTRCENPNKCSRTVTYAGELQKELKSRRNDDPFRIILVTYDPVTDDRERLSQYAMSRGAELSAGNLTVLRPLDGSLSPLCDELLVPVGFALGNVAVHDVVAYLLDKRGAPVRIYRVALPDFDRLLRDVDMLAAEEKLRADS